MTGSHSFTATLGTGTNNFVPALYDSTDVSTVLESIPVPKSGGIYPPTFQVTFTYNLLQDRIYRVILWESPDTDPHGLNRVSGDFKASLNTIHLRAPLYLTADISAGLVSGTAGYVDPTGSLNGWVYELEQLGYGTLEPGAGKDYTLDGTTNDWTLVNGQTIGQLQKFVIRFQPQVSAAAQPPISAISTGRVITASTTLTGTDKNKALWVRASGSNIAITLMALSSLADYDRVVIYSAGGNHINLVVNTAGTDKIQLNTLVTRIMLGQAEKLELVKANGQFEVDFLSPSYWDVGKYILRPTKGEVNTIFGSGGTLLRADYPRATDYVLNRLTSNEKCAEASWAATTTVDGVSRPVNKGFWTEGDGVNTIRVPQLYVNGFIKGVDGISRYAGSNEFDMTIDHQHEGTIGTLSSGGPGLFGIGLTRNKGNYNGRGSGATDLVSKAGIIHPVTGLFVQSQRLGGDVHPANTGAYISICI